jgi:hypothetical protein
LKHLLLPLGVATAAGLAAPELETEYRPGEAVRVELATTITLETTAMEMERDGEPVEGRFGAGGPTETTRHVVHVDTVVEATDGAPTVVRRAFEEVGGKTIGTRRDEAFERELESPFAGVTLELTLEDDEVQVEVVEGSEPDHDGALEGHRLALGLDALLPSGEVAVDEEWELEAEAVRRAIGADVRAALFPPPSPGERGQGGRGGGGGGGRGGRGAGGGDQGGQALALAEWEGTAVLASIEEGDDGSQHATIELELEADGELPERVFGPRGGRGGGGGLALAPGTAPLRATTFEVELEGTLTFDIDAHRPVSLELEGTLSVSSETERETPNGGTFRMSREQSGTVSITTTITEAEADDSASSN